jgi:2-polyprenyl-3-methyl-5-hydroxy-6-metoxy-1,4-benzoquinol methylase
MKNNDKVERIIKKLYEEYWPSYDSEVIRAGIKRHCFHIDMILSTKGINCTICDIGGGWGIFSAVCAQLGMKSVLVDDFRDEGFFDFNDPRFEMQRYYGIEIISRDVIKDGIDFPPETFDAFTCIDSMEHWHHSPKTLFYQLVNALKPGGIFVLGVPNCVSLHKRVAALLGYGRWSTMADWYEKTSFRGHMREPNVKDLIYIANDIGLVEIKIIGRNWLLMGANNKVIRLIAPIYDRITRLRPSFCTSLYMVGKKP